MSDNRAGLVDISFFSTMRFEKKDYASRRISFEDQLAAIQHELDKLSSPLTRLNASLLSRYNEMRRLRRAFQKKIAQHSSRLFEMQRFQRKIQRHICQGLQKQEDVATKLVQLSLEEEEEEFERRCRRATTDVLPIEILGDIFCLVVDASRSSSKFDSLDTRKSAPWVISHVGHRWRSIALSFPELWSHVLINDTPLTPGRESALQHVLTWSGAYPLHVSMDDCCLFHHLYLHASHLSSLECHSLLHPEELQQIAATDLPMLKVLYINSHIPPDEAPVDDTDPSPEAPPPDPLFRHAPQLVEFHLFGLTLSLFPPPWSQIRTFKGDIISYDDFRLLCQSAINLEDAHISFRPKLTTLPPVDACLFFPSLRHLSLYTDKPCVTQIHSPNLQTFCLSPLLTPLLQVNLMVGLEGFISEHKLDALFLNFVASWPSLHPILENCGSCLRVLSLNVTGVVAWSLYRALTNGGDMACCVPNLEVLYLRDEAYTGRVLPRRTMQYACAFVDDQLVTMVESRLGVSGDVKRLQQLVLCAPYSPFSEGSENMVLRKLKGLQETHGFVFTVH